MDKPNTFRSSNFYMSDGDILHILIRDESGTAVSLELYGVGDNINPEDSGYGQLTDYDGNVYTTVIIGTQEWIIENLRVTHYSDGTAIPELTLDADWLAEDGTAGHDGAWCYYDNDSSNLPAYGLLYNNYAVRNAKGLVYFERDGVQETGWRVPSTIDFETLRNYFGGVYLAGGKLKSTGTDYWLSPNTGATNESGLSINGSGSRDPNGTFTGLKEEALLFSSTGSLSFFYGAYLSYFNKAFLEHTLGDPLFSREGLAVRCVRDISSYIPITITVDATPGFTISNPIGYAVVGESTIRVTFMCDAFPVVSGGGFGMSIEDAGGDSLFYAGPDDAYLAAETGVFFDSNLMDHYTTGIPLSRALVNGDSLTVKCFGGMA